MRTIKFRAWDKHNKRMLAWGYPVNCWIRWLDGQDKEIEIMQFTGLLDKNGKEIYEGDIVKVSGILQKKENRVIGWWTDKLCWGYVYDTGEQYMQFSYKMNGFRKDILEVIGNIYENPELIK